MKIEEQSVRELAMNAIFEVFEKMYYIFLEPRDFEQKDEARKVVRIRFSGATSGEMMAYYGKNLAPCMIENALGLDQSEQTDQIMEDCLKECINMVCGNFLQKLEPDRVLHLSIPEYLGEVKMPAAGDAQCLYLSFESEEMPIEITLRISEAAE